MDAAHLRKKGWSEQEILHAQRIFESAESKKHPEVAFSEHVRLWTLLGILLVGTSGVSIALLPVLLFIHPVLSTGIVIILGVCTGVLLSAALGSLNIHHAHHHHGVSWLVIAVVVVLTLGFALLEDKYGTLPGTWHPNPILLAIIFALAMVAPYIAQRRLHGTA